jgi:hypothetical protein
MLKTKQDFATAFVIVTICASPFLVMLVHDRCAVSNAVAEEEARIAKAKADVAEAEARAKAEPPWREKTLEEIKAEGQRAKAMREEEERRENKCTARIEEGKELRSILGERSCDTMHNGTSHAVICSWSDYDGHLRYSETYRWSDVADGCRVSSYAAGTER